MSERELRLERRYPSSPAAVFEGWRDIDKVRRWFGCGPGQLWDVHQWECTPGGGLHVSMTIDGHGRVDVRGEFLVVEAPSRLEYRWDETETVTVTFEAIDDGTLMRLHHRDIVPGKGDRVAGWTYCVDALGRFLDAG